MSQAVLELAPDRVQVVVGARVAQPLQEMAETAVSRVEVAVEVALVTAQVPVTAAPVPEAKSG